MLGSVGSNLDQSQSLIFVITFFSTFYGTFVCGIRLPLLRFIGAGLLIFYAINDLITLKIS